MQLEEQRLQIENETQQRKLREEERHKQQELRRQQEAEEERLQNQIKLEIAHKKRQLEIDLRTHLKTNFLGANKFFEYQCKKLVSLDEYTRISNKLSLNLG